MINDEKDDLLEARLDLYAKLAEAEALDKNGDDSEDFFEYAKKLREKLTGKI
jgi:hypothetical protein